MSFEPRDYLQHILAEADYLVERSHGVTRAPSSPTRRCGGPSCAASR